METPAGDANDHGPHTPAGTVRLRPPRHRVEPRAVAWWTTRAATEVVPVLVGLGVAAWWFGAARAWLLTALVVAAVVGIGYVAVMPRWRYHVHRYETTDDAVYTASGWIIQEWRVAPLSRIQTVDTERGPLQQLFGLSSVTVTTASAAGPLTIAGLDHERAADIVASLTAATQATPGDAT